MLNNLIQILKNNLTLKKISAKKKKKLFEAWNKHTLKSFLN